MAEAESDSSLTANLSGTEKSAILMMVLGGERWIFEPHNIE